MERVRASHLAATGRCEKALEIAQTVASRDAATELMIGKCAIQAQQYARALPALERAGELDSGLVGVNLYRGIALYHLEDFEASRAALSDARAVGDEVALLEFYNGLLLLRDDEPRKAALAFERAAARGPDLVEPVASYYAALAWQSLNENEPLNSAVDRVRDEEPEGPWAEEAEKLVALQAQRHRGGQTGLQRWLNLRLGEEYDSNVLLHGEGSDLPDLPAGFSDDDDWRTVWSVSAGAEVAEIEKWTLGVMLGYAGNAHDDLDAFDAHYLVGTFWADREIRPTTVGRLRMDIGAGWVDDDPYVYDLSLEAIVEERWGRWGTTKGSFGLDFNDYRYDIDLGTEDETKEYGDLVDQDGMGIHVGVEHELPLTVVRALELDLYGG
ncbi:MAG: hypothetical protein GY944_04740, partial [bacterium]|nr:hypothetical protein [bacterium]